MMKANQDDEMGEEEERGRVGTDGVIRTWLLGSDVRAQLPLGVGARNQGRLAFTTSCDSLMLPTTCVLHLVAYCYLYDHDLLLQCSHWPPLPT